MDLKQARLETPQAYYERLRLAYFGPRNEAHMEEDVSFKTLFLRNLHPSQSAHLGVLVCPRTLSIQQLRDLAHKAYVKQKTVSEKPVKYPTVCAVSAPSPELALEGAQPTNYEPGNKQSRPFQAGRGHRNRGGVRPRPQNDRFGGSWDRHPPQNTAVKPQTSTPAVTLPNDSSTHSLKLTAPQNTAVKSQTITPAVTLPNDSSTHFLMLTAPQNTAVKPKTIKLAAASQNDSSTHSLKLTAPQNTTVKPKTIKLAAASPNDSSTHSLQLTTTLPAKDCSSSHNKMPDSAVLVICTNNETLETYPHCLSINTQEPMPQLLGNLIERGVARKLYLSITLEKEMQLEALVDTGSDLTLISAQLFQKLKFEAQRQNRTLKFHTCELNVQSYSQNDIQLRNLAPIQQSVL
ncbi:hypothetical protein PO909_017975 [Leuciscus waleckii]